VTPPVSPASSRDDAKHPAFDPLTDIGPSGVLKIESKYLLLSETSPFVEYCSRCREVCALAGGSIERLGDERYVHLSLSSSGHVFAFRVIKRETLRREYDRVGLAFDLPPLFRKGRAKKSLENRMVKLTLRVTPQELSLIDEDMKKSGLTTRAAVIRGILFAYYRGDFGSRETLAGSSVDNPNERVGTNG